MNGQQFSEASAPVSRRRGALLVLLVLVSVSAGFLGGWAGGRVNGSDIGNLKNQSNEVKQQVVLNESELIANIAKNVGPSVVSINVTSDISGGFFGASYAAQSAGTGIIISDSGVIVTNRHVVPSGSGTVSITLSDGTELATTVIGRDSVNDVAFLKVTDKKGKSLKAANLGDSSKMRVGDKVVAIGNALGEFQNTVTSGIISGLGRPITASDQTGLESEDLTNLFQTDAAINEGNSGGPLVNINGEVVGINTAIAGGAQNIGFSIPINDVKGVIKSVLDKGRIIRPFLGVRYIELTEEFAKQNNLPVNVGAYIPPDAGGSEAIVTGSPAAKAGLKPSDIITKIDDQTIDGQHSLSSVLGAHNVGDKIKLSVVRDGKSITLEATLAETPSS